MLEKKKPCYGYWYVDYADCCHTPPIGQVLFMYYVTRVGPHKNRKVEKKQGFFVDDHWMDRLCEREGVPAFGGREGVEVGKSRLVCFLLFYLFSL